MGIEPITRCLQGIVTPRSLPGPFAVDIWDYGYPESRSYVVFFHPLGGTRTHSRLVRSQVICPVNLQGSFRYYVPQEPATCSKALRLELNFAERFELSNGRFADDCVSRFATRREKEGPSRNRAYVPAMAQTRGRWFLKPVTLQRPNLHRSTVSWPIPRAGFEPATSTVETCDSSD